MIGVSYFDLPYLVEVAPATGLDRRGLLRHGARIGAASVFYHYQDVTSSVTLTGTAVARRSRCPSPQATRSRCTSA